MLHSQFTIPRIDCLPGGRGFERGSVTCWLVSLSYSTASICFHIRIYFLFSFSGLGFGLIYLPAIVSVGYYFEEKRAFATGLAVCGSGLGAFIFNPFSKYLIDEFGWRGAILIEAGLILNCVLCGALFRPLLPKKKSSEELELKEKPKLDSELIKDSTEIEVLVKASNGVTANGDGHLIPQQSSANHRGSHENLLKPPARDASLFLSDGALHRPAKKPRQTSPLANDHTDNGKPVVFRRLLSEDHHHHSHRHHHVTGKLLPSMVSIWITIIT